MGMEAFPIYTSCKLIDPDMYKKWKCIDACAQYFVVFFLFFLRDYKEFIIVKNFKFKVTHLRNFVKINPV